MQIGINMNNTLRLTKLLLVAALLALLAGCASRTPMAGNNEILAYKKPGMALIVGSVVNEDGTYAFSSSVLKARLRDPGKEYTFELMGSGKRPMQIEAEKDFSVGRFSGNLVAIVVPAGTYEYYTYHLAQATGMTTVYWDPKFEFSVPFHIQENKINYVGEIVIHTQIGKSLLGIPVADGGIWSIGEARDRDIPMLKARYPSLPWDDLVAALPTRSDQPEIVLVNDANHHLYASNARPSADQQQVVIDEINQGNLARNREIARKMVADHAFEEAILDAMATQVKANYLLNKDDRLWLDSVAWMCKAIALSKNPKYKPLIEEVSKVAANERLRRYATSYLPNFI